MQKWHNSNKLTTPRWKVSMNITNLEKSNRFEGGKRSKQPWRRCLHKVQDGSGNACSYRSSPQESPQTTSPCLPSKIFTEIYGKIEEPMTIQREGR